jgi:hypothetical protein
MDRIVCLGRHWAVGRQGALRSPEKQREHPRLNPERLLIGASGGVRTDEVACKPDSQHLHDLSASHVRSLTTGHRDGLRVFGTFIVRMRCSMFRNTAVTCCTAASLLPVSSGLRCVIDH